MSATDDRARLLYLAPWVDVGGADTGTIDWFASLDREHFSASLITTQPSPNRRLAQLTPYATEIWDLPELMSGDAAARFIVGFIRSRRIELVQIMNSRLGFELLPEIARLSRRPKVVVQLHVENPDGSGYVRYVTTRFGNLIDAYSVSSCALSERLAAYDVPPAKRRVIATGVDSEVRFAAGRVAPAAGLGIGGQLEILFPARLTAQKDPLLMVEVAAKLRASRLRFRVHVLGDGELVGAVRQRVQDHGLENQVILHGETTDVVPWYEGCDLVLMTSAFEGVPYVAYEAMAIGTVLVAPELPGVDELVTPGTGVLVSQREDPDAYAAAILELAGDPEARAAIVASARSRAAELPLSRMAAEHAKLYDELLATRPDARVQAERETAVPQPGLRGRGSRTGELVSVIVPCFNHGHYLSKCLESIGRQTYAPIETIVVDDCSTDPGTLEALAATERRGDVTVLRLPVNAGPGAARNAAIEAAAGRYVLPVDADDVLLPGAVAALVEQLRSAGERVGFVYPNLQFFGNRTDYFEAPSYNLDALLRNNYCDTASLIDREVFDLGLRFSDDRDVTDEDWDFFLTLAEHGIYGEAAECRTLQHRKVGYTRSDWTNPEGAKLVASRHPKLFESRSRARLKGEWNPAISVVALDRLASAQGAQKLAELATRQTCSDFELLVTADEDLPSTALARRLRRLPAAIVEGRADAVAIALQLAKGRRVLACYGSPNALFADRALVEKLLRAFAADQRVRAIALADAGGRRVPLGLLSAGEVAAASLWGLCWTSAGPEAPPPSLELAGCDPLDTLARWLTLGGPVQWRQLAAPGNAQPAAPGNAQPAARGAVQPAAPGGALPAGGRPAQLGAPRHRRRRDLRVRTDTPAELPGAPSDDDGRGVWQPPQSRLLCRHVDDASGQYAFTCRPQPPLGLRLDRVLGCLHDMPFAGAIALATSPAGFALGGAVDHDAPELLGFVGQSHFVLMDPLLLGRHLETGQQVLVAGDDDALASKVTAQVCIGYLDAVPIHPRTPTRHDVPYGLLGLVRAVDAGGRRHRYGLGGVPAGRLAGELGALLTQPLGECRPLWLDAGGALVADDDGDRTAVRPTVATAASWTAGPLAWTSAGDPAVRLRAAGRRAFDSALALAPIPQRRLPRPLAAAPGGYLLRAAAPFTVPLYSAAHPVIADQLLSTCSDEAARLGYREPTLLGHLVARPTVTDQLGIISPGVPWATNFGLAR